LPLLEQTLLGCAWIERAWFTLKTLNRKGSWLPNLEVTFVPRTEGLASIYVARGVSDAGIEN